MKKIKQAKWGDKVLQNISVELQKELPGLKGFSFRNLRNMRQFFNAYSSFPIGQSATAQLESTSKSHAASAQLHKATKRQSATAQIQKEKQPFTSDQTESVILEHFISVSFTHHVLLMTIKDVSERFFYMQQAAINHWTVNFLRHHIESDLYKQKGRLISNFKTYLNHWLRMRWMLLRMSISLTLSILILRMMSVYSNRKL